MSEEESIVQEAEASAEEAPSPSSVQTCGPTILGRLRAFANKSKKRMIAWKLAEGLLLHGPNPAAGVKFQQGAGQISKIENAGRKAEEAAEDAEEIIGE